MYILLLVSCSSYGGSSDKELLIKAFLFLSVETAVVTLVGHIKLMLSVSYKHFKQ